MNEQLNGNLLDPSLPSQAHVLNFTHCLTVLVCIATLTTGCADHNADKTPIEASFTPSELSREEHAKKLELLYAIVDKTYLNEQDLNQTLKGKPVSDYATILSYADTFTVHGEYSSYDYVSRVHDPEQPERLEEGDGFLSIVVKNELIFGVSYDVLCR